MWGSCKRQVWLYSWYIHSRIDLSGGVESFNFMATHNLITFFLSLSFQVSSKSYLAEEFSSSLKLAVSLWSTNNIIFTSFISYAKNIFNGVPKIFTLQPKNFFFSMLTIFFSYCVWDAFQIGLDPMRLSLAHLCIWHFPLNWPKKQLI